MNKTIKNALILCAITLIAGLLLGGVYEITKDAREEQLKKTQNEAYQSVFKDAASFEAFEYDKDEISIKLGENGITEKNVKVDGVVSALDENKSCIGYVINVTAKEGFAGDISFSVGIDSKNNVTGISILSIGETAGLGMNAKDEVFLSQYLAERNGLFVVNKEDNTEGTNIDAISGATITTNAVTKGVNTAILVAESILSEVKD